MQTPPIIRRRLLAETTRCPACGVGLTTSGRTQGQIDRLIPGLPYGRHENLRVLCARCNTAKSDMTAAELRRLADWVDKEATAS